MKQTSNISVSRARGQSSEFATLNYSGGRIQAGQFLEFLKAYSESRSTPLPRGMDREMLKEILNNPDVQNFLQAHTRVPSARQNGSWI